MHKDDTSNKPWIENYPPLRDWLRKIEARCDFQVPYGKGKYMAYIEQWRAPGSMPFIVLVRPSHGGWEIFTPHAGEQVDATLKDAEARIRATPLTPYAVGRDKQLARDLTDALDQIEKVPAIDVAIKTIRYVRDVLETTEVAGGGGSPT